MVHVLCVYEFVARKEGRVLLICAKKRLLSTIELGPQTGEFGVSSSIVLLCDGYDSGRTWAFSCRRVSFNTFSVLRW